MKKGLLLVITFLLLGWGSLSFSSSGSDGNDYNEAEPWDDIYSQTVEGHVRPDTSSTIYSISGTITGRSSTSLKRAVDQGGPLRGRRQLSFWSRVKYFLLSLWR